MVAIPFKSMFQSYLDGNEKEWAYNRDLSLGASEVFTCMRKSFFKKFGYESDDGLVQDWGAAKRGDIIENHFAVPAVQSIIGNAKLIMAGDDQHTLKKGRLSATPDGLVIEADRDSLAELGIPDMLSSSFVTEFKSFDPRSNIKEAKPVHVGQVQVQLGLLHELTEHRPEYGLVIYFNASFLSDIRIYVVKRDPKIYAAAKERARQVYATDNPKDLMAEGKVSGDCTTCDYTEECAIAQGEATPKTKKKIADQAVLDRLQLLVVRQKGFAAASKEAEHERKVADEEIKEILRAADTKGVSEDGYTISLSFCAGKKSTDLLAMAADGIKIEDYQKEGSGFERLVVKLKGAPDD